jgi:hypothetical protein
MRAAIAEARPKRVDTELVEFERLSQSPNDVAAMKSRMTTLLKYIENPTLIKGKRRALK